MRSVPKRLNATIKNLRPASRRPTMRVAATSRAPRRPENVPGSFYVDDTCIDCGTCMWMQRDVFQEVSGQSAVVRQPVTKEERVLALQATLSCPTFSIHADDRSAEDLKEALEGFPRPVPGLKDVFHLGFHDRSSFGATPYLIKRPTGNILVDAPRFNPKTLSHLQQAGGVKYFFLTHQDDVGDHNKWAEALGGPLRIIHSEDVNHRTRTVELQLTGDGPWRLPDDSEDVELIFTPGHTRGCVSLLYKPEHVLFTGDHLAYSMSRGGLYVFHDACWYSLPVQLKSVEKLLGLGFTSVLPGHGAPTPAPFPSVEAKDEALRKLLEEEKSYASSKGARWTNPWP